MAIRGLNPRGFTIIEAVAAIALSTCAIMAAMFFSAQTSSAARTQRISSQGFLLLQNLSESLLINNGQLDSLGHSDLATGVTHRRYFDQASNVISYADYTGVAPADPAKTVMTLEWTVLPNTPVQNLIEIHALLRWGASGGAPGVLSMVFNRPVPIVTSDLATSPIPIGSAPPPAPAPTPSPTSPSPTPTSPGPTPTPGPSYGHQ